MTTFLLATLALAGYAAWTGELRALVAVVALTLALVAADLWRRARRAPAMRGAIAGVAVFAVLPLGALRGDPTLTTSLLVRSDALVPVDALFIASGDVDFHRTRYGAEVFARSGAKWFVVSGAGSGGDSGALMAEAAIGFGVPRESIVVEERATTTRENVLFTRALLRDRGVRRVAVVTDPLHSRRLALSARRAWRGVHVIAATVPADQDPLAGNERAAALEWKKLLGYAALGWL